MNSNKFFQNQKTNSTKKEETAIDKAKQLYQNIGKINSKWIVSGADIFLPDYAEKLGEILANSEDKGNEHKLTNSQIRSIYGEIKRIQISGFNMNKSSFYLLRPKMAYAAGRNKNNERVQLFKLFFEDAWKEVKDEDTFKNFCNLIEAVLAYHKAFGGKE